MSQVKPVELKTHECSVCDTDTAAGLETQYACPSCQEILALVERFFPHQRETTGPIRFDSRLVEDLAFDSLDATELVMSLENSLGISLPDDIPEHLGTVADLVRTVREQVASSC